MTETVQRQSATIYQFPKRGRFAAGQGDSAGTVTSIAAAKVSRAALGGAWYHDEAIADERSRTR